MDKLKQSWNNLVTKWKSLSLRTKLLIVAGVGLGGGLLVSTCM